MMSKERSLPPKRSKAQSIGVKMSSLLNTSSHFDRANASTVEGTQMSVQHVFDSSTDVDPAEQRHNSMNLALELLQSAALPDALLLNG